MHMGFVTDAEVKAVHKAPAGDPTVYSVDGMEIALRKDTAKAIQIRAAAFADTSLALLKDRGTHLGVSRHSAGNLPEVDLVELAEARR